MFLKIVIDKIWYFNLILIIVLGSIFYLALIRHARYTTIERVKNQERMLARAQAVNISTFFEVFGQSISVIAQSPSIKTKSTNAEKVMDSFVEQWRSSGLVGGIILVDKDGVVIYNSNVLGVSYVGNSIADRDYFVWAEGAMEGEYFVGKPVVSRLGASLGKTIVPVASPIFMDGEFTGLLGSSVILDDLTANYLGVMKVSQSTRSILIDEAGNVIYGDPLDGDTGYVLSDQNLDLGNRIWHIDVVTPVEEIEQSLKPIYIRYFGIFVLVTLSIVLYSILIDRIKVTK